MSCDNESEINFSQSAKTTIILFKMGKISKMNYLIVTIFVGPLSTGVDTLASAMADKGILLAR